MLRRNFRFLREMDAVVASIVRSLQYAPTYLRHVPPSLYLSCDMHSTIDGGYLERHLTRLLDCADQTRPPHSFGVYALRTTSVDDLHFENDETLSSALIGVPRVRTADEAQRFVETHRSQLRGLNLVLLPELHPSAGCVVQAIQKVFPHARIAGSAFAKAFLSDFTFFGGVREKMIENDPAICDNAITFAALDAGACYDELVDGLSLWVSQKNGSRTRCIRVCSVRSYPHQKDEQRKVQRHHPPHFKEERFFFYDTVFQSMHVGASMGCLPWLPHFLKESKRETVLPLPPLMSARYCHEDGVLLDVWHMQETVDCLESALRKVPHVERVLASGYGELPGSLEDVANCVKRTACQLESLRSRLSRRLKTTTEHDIHKWSQVVLNKVLKEIFCVNPTSEPTSTQMLSNLQRWAAQEDLGDLCKALTRAAIYFAKTEPQQTETEKSNTSQKNNKSVHRERKTNREQKEELGGAQGVVLLQSIFDKKGLKGLNKVLKKHEIDVRVFLSMSHDDFKQIFKATFSVSRKLELLQKELKEKASSDE